MVAFFSRFELLICPWPSGKEYLNTGADFSFSTIDQIIILSNVRIYLYLKYKPHLKATWKDINLPLERFVCFEDQG